jgi:tetratricopeptide (TPR) repeat protein
MKDNKTREEHRVIEDAISEFGLESMKAAEMFLKADDLYAVRVLTRGDDPKPMVRLDMPINKQVSLERPTALAHYLFSDPTLVDERVKQLEKAFAFAIPIWAQDDPEALNSAIEIFHFLSVCYGHADTFEKWESLCTRILSMLRIKLGRNHTRVMHYLLYMGGYYLAIDKLDKADDCFKEAAAILETHPELKITESPKQLLNFAGILFKQGRMALALCTLDEAMEKLKQAPVMDKVVLLVTLVDYAAVYKVTDNLEEFDRVSLEAEKTAQEVWQSKWRWVITPALSLIRSNESLGRLNVAGRLLKWLVTTMESLADREVPSMASHEAWVHFLNDCQLNGLPMSVEKVIPELAAQLSGNPSGYVH